MAHILEYTYRKTLQKQYAKLSWWKQPWQKLKCKIRLKLLQADMDFWEK